MTKFQIEDLVCLKAHPTRVAVVEKTHHDVDTHTPIGEVWIVDHLNYAGAGNIVNTEWNDLLTNFLWTSVPPLGYVFVEFTNAQEGFSLLKEEDLVLKDRIFAPGDVVKKDLGDSVLGMVIDVSETFTLAPVMKRSTNTPDGLPVFVEQFSGLVASNCMTAPSDQCIHGVSRSEIKQVTELIEGTEVLGGQWFGQVSAVEPEVVIMLEDGSIVQVNTPDELEISLPEYNHFIYRPNYEDRKPPDSDVVGKHTNSSAPCSGYIDQFYPGQAVVTNTWNIRQGRWLHGKYNKDVLTRGHILQARVAWADVQWICPSPFGGDREKASVDHCPYPRQFVIDGKFKGDVLAAYDKERLPEDGSGPRTRSCFEICSSVRFREPEKAQEKYGGSWTPIPENQTYGFDMNAFKIIGSQSTSTVRWSDSSVTTHQNNDLQKFVSFETDFFPTQIVAHKEEITKRNLPGDKQDDNILCLNKVGVIQSVDAEERVASVRWYERPQVQVAREGTVLIAGSRFGPIGDETTDVSYYELVKYPVIEPIIGDFAIISPAYVMPSDGQPTLKGVEGPVYLRGLFPASERTLRSAMKHVRASLFKNGACKLIPDDDQGRTATSNRRDWAGQIIGQGMDGKVIVRLGADTKIRDLHLNPEEILVTIDAHAVGLMGSSGPDDGYLDSDRFSIPPWDVPEDLLDAFGALEEQWKFYNKRETEEDSDEMDVDSDHEPEDEEWETDDGEGEEENEEGTSVDEMDIDSDSEEPPTNGLKTKQDQSKILAAAKLTTEEKDWYTTLSESSTSSPPLSFDFLETEPPSNHAFVSKEQNTDPKVLRRINKEYKILRTSLPDGIFVRTWESRFDLFRVLITGPAGTPYELAPFIIDFHLGSDFPVAPPKAHFHSWTNGQGRVNPNLYEEGKICLSLLGTWPGRGSDENWDASKSTLLQILVSLVGLVLVKEPYYNEAGFDAVDPTSIQNAIESIQYTEKAFVMTRAFVVRALTFPVPGFEDVLSWLYFPTNNGDLNYDSSSREVQVLDKAKGGKKPDLLNRVIQLAEGMVRHHKNSPKGIGGAVNGDAASPFVQRLSRGAVLMLQKQLVSLKKIRDEAWSRGEQDQVSGQLE